MKTLVALLLFSFLAFPLKLKADGAGPDEAQIQTQELLNNKSEREKVINSDPKGQDADQFIKKLTGGDEKLTDEVYALAAEVFANVVKDCNHDVNKMKEAMEKFSKDPNKFASQWSDDQKKKLKELSEKLDVPLLKK